MRYTKIPFFLEEPFTISSYVFSNEAPLLLLCYNTRELSAYISKRLFNRFKKKKKKNVSSSRTNNVSCRPALNLCFPGAARYKREGDARTRTWLGGVLNLLCLQKSNKKLHPVIINI